MGRGSALFCFKDITTDTIPIIQPVNMTLKGTTSAYCVSFNLIYLIISTIILSEYIRYTLNNIDNNKIFVHELQLNVYFVLYQIKTIHFYK